MKNQPKVFIVILNWNGKDTLLDCLRSVFGLSYSNYEVVVVDNASRDGSIEAVKSLFSRSHFILNHDYVGFASGMNVGIRYAFSKGTEYVWILNNDVECDKDALFSLVSAAKEYDTPALYSPHIVTPAGDDWFSGGKIDYIRMRAEHVSEEEKIVIGAPYKTGYLSGCALFASRKAIEITGLFDEAYFLYYEDADLSVRALKKGVDLVVVPEAVITHSEQSEQNPDKIYWLVRSGLRFFKTHTPFPARIWMWIFVPMRKMKNSLDKFRGKKEALPVSSAYADSRAL